MPGEVREQGRVWLALGASVAGHGVLQMVRRANHLNGLANEVGGTVVTGSPRDPDLTLLLLGSHALGIAALFALYALIVTACARPGQRRVLARGVIGSALLLHLALVFVHPHLSIDLMSYLGHGKILADGMNPHAVAVSDLAGTDFGRELAAFGWRPAHGPSPYGPILTWVEWFAATVAVRTHSIYAGMIAFKLVAVAAVFACAFAAASAARRLAPGAGVAAAAVVLWNPSVLIETAAEGHNESLAAAALVGAFACAAARRWFLAGALITLATAAKYLPLLAAPALGILVLRTSPRNGLRAFLLGGGVALAAGALLAVPFWPDVFTGVAHNMRSEYYYGSVAALLRDGLSINVPDVVFMLVLLAVLVGATHRVTTPAQAAVSALIVLACYVFVVGKQVYSWYPVPLVGLAATLGGRPALLLAAAVSLPTALVAPVEPAVVNRAFSISGQYPALGSALAGALGSIVATAAAVAHIRRQRATVS